jgi:protein phosphatase
MSLPINDPSLILLIGPSGAGKSTFAHAHFRPTEIVSSDDLRAMLTDDAADQDASAEAFHILSLVINGRLKRRLLTVVDATNLRAANRKSYRRLAARYGIPVVAIAFDSAVHEYLSRNAGRPDRVVDDEVVTSQADRMAVALVDLADEGYESVHILRGDEESVEVVVRRRGEASTS